MKSVDIKKLDYTVEETDGFKTERTHIIGRLSDGERVHVYNDEVNSYFYVPREQFDEELRTDDRVMKFEHGHTSVKGDELTRIYTYIPGHVPGLREDYDHHEADILFPNRFSIDTGIYGGMNIPDEHANNEPSEIPLSDIDVEDHNFNTRIMFCDIEVDDTHGFPDEKEAEEEIVCLSFYDSFTDEYFVYLYRDDEPEVNLDTEYVEDANVEVFGSEVEMLKKFANVVNAIEPDVMAGWNFKKFDAMYLISRFDRLTELNQNMLSPLGQSYNDGWYGGKIKGIAIFDMLKAYKQFKFTELDSYSLEDVAQDELGIGKLGGGEEKIHKLWENDIDKLLEYNLRDVYLTVELENSQAIVQFYEQVANFVGGRLAEVVDYSKAADIYVLRMINDLFVVPSMRTIGSKSDDEKFEGAEVFDPASEIKDMVSVLDLKSLYPMSMKTINAGPRTKDPDGEITAPNGVSFTKEKKSVISDIIDNLLSERDEKKRLRSECSPGTKEYQKFDLQQQAVKVIMNTLYGILGWDRFRLYDEDVAAAVTATGREIIKFTQQEANKKGYNVIYGDTDSIMLEIDDASNLREIVEINYELEAHINRRYDDFALQELNVKDHYFEIEFEKVYRKFVQAGKKKRYAGHIVWKEGEEVDKIDIVGFEVQRSDYSTKAKDLQKSMINAILMGATKDEVSQLVRDEIDRIKNLEYDLDEIGIPGGIGQAFDKYTNKTKHVRAAEYANNYFGEDIQPGDKPKGLYVDKLHGGFPDPPQMKDSAFICWMNPSNVPDPIEYDWDKYMEVQIYGPLSRIIEGTEWSWGEILTGQDQSGVESFGNGDEPDNMAGFNGEFDNSEEEDESSQFDEFGADDMTFDNIEDDADTTTDTTADSTSLDEFDGSEDDDDVEEIQIMSKDEIIAAANGGEKDDDNQADINNF